MGSTAQLSIPADAKLKSPVAIAHAVYNHELVSGMLEDFAAAVRPCLTLPLRQLQVPGSLELAHALRLMAADTPRPCVLVALGCVIRGDTRHFEIVCDVSAHALQRASEDTGIPVINGVLTCENAEQAGKRAKSKGAEFAAAAVHMALMGCVE